MAISFASHGSFRNLLGFHETSLYKEYDISPNPVDILSFDKFFVHTDIAQGMIFKGKRSGIIHNFTMDVAPGYKNNDKIRGGMQWYMMDTIGVLSSISFKLKNENN